VSVADLHIVRHNLEAGGTNVVLVHGAPDRSKSFGAVLQELPDVRITTYDRRGYGKSHNAPLEGRGFEEHAEDLIAILDGTPSVVVGQSAGGAIAMMASTLAPDLFLALGVWEPPLTWCDFWPAQFVEDTKACLLYGTRELGEFMNRRTIGDERWEALPERTRDLLQIEGTAFHADMACQLTPPFDIRNIKAPMVIGYGPESQGPGPLSAKHLAAITGGELFEGVGADHYAHTAQPKLWAELVRKTVARSTSQP
jgi:pimeloyl-ACP methyl ester carboxylesterase